MKRGFVTVLLLILLAVVSVTFAYYYGTQQGKPAGTPVPTPTVVVLPTTSPTPTAKMNVPAGWKTYTNDQYGFEISYPPAYQALTDKNNLYGWPNGIALIYNGGQSYDLAIEHWNTQAEYENKYKNQTNVTVKKTGDVYITLLNMNFETEVDNIIATFRAI